MDSGTLLVAGLLGVLVGAIAMLAFRVSEREQRRTGKPSDDDDLPAGVGQVLAVIRSAAVVVDESGLVVKASAAAYVFGLVRGDRLVHAETSDLVAEVRRTGIVADDEFSVPRGPVGLGTMVIDVRVAPLGTRYVVIFAEDRTESRRLEEIRRDFVANVSHELKTPVGAISLLAEAVQDASDDPEAVARFAGRMRTEAARLSSLVQEIIELSRLQVVDAFADLSPVNIDGVVTDAVDRASAAARAKRINIDIGGEHGRVVYGDHGLLVTAVRNLLDNAVNYSDPGTHIGVGVRDRDGLVEIDVVDQGMGISPDDQGRVFERFYRVDAARSRSTGGTGLGLSIVKHIAANHGGDVTVWSVPGRGSTFTLRIPTAEGPHVNSAGAGVDTEGTDR